MVEQDKGLQGLLGRGVDIARIEVGLEEVACLIFVEAPTAIDWSPGETFILTTKLMITNRKSQSSNSVKRRRGTFHTSSRRVSV